MMSRKPAEPASETAGLREQVRHEIERAQHAGLSLNKIASLSGLPFSTVRRAANSHGDPRISTLERMRKAIRKVARDAEADLRQRAMDLARRAPRLLPFVQYAVPAFTLTHVHGFALHDRVCLICDLLRAL